MEKENVCKNIFKTEKTITTSKEITQAFINMINSIEKSKAMLYNTR